MNEAGFKSFRVYVHCTYHAMSLSLFCRLQRRLHNINARQTAMTSQIEQKSLLVA